MSISAQFAATSRKFVIIIVGLTVLSVGLLAVVLFETNNVRFSDDVSSEELHSVIADDEAVVEYLEDEKDFEAHFVTIASLVKQEQQNDLAQALLITSGIMIVLIIIPAYFVARYLLKPVKEAYLSQERFMQDAAHELRNPLAAMSLSIENAKKRPKSDLELIKTMERQTKRLIRINEDLLYLERQNPDGVINKINISELLEDILEDLQPAISAKKLKLSKQIQSDIHYKMDAKDFIKLSRNIIENAIKYTKSGKKVSIELKQDKHIELAVTDQGIGIPEADLSKVGERFFRAKNVAKVDGTGLGIAIVKKVLNLYGGQLQMTSKVGKGTTVKITL